MKTLRAKLITATAGGMALLLGALGLAVYSQVRSTLYREFDSALQTKAAALAAFVDADNDRVVLDDEAAQMPEFSRARNPEYYQLLDSRGHILRSPSLGGHNLLPALPRPAAPASPVTLNLTLPGGAPGRVALLTIPLHADHGEHDEHDDAPAGRDPLVTLAVARDQTGLQRTLARIAFMLAVLSAGAIALSTGILALLVRRTMRVMDRLAAQLADLGAADLARRVELCDVPGEFQPVVHTVNALLARLADAFDRERAFSSDVAHELRTPLASLQTTLDVSLRRPRDPDAYRASLTRCHAIARQMRSLVENLLIIARADSGQLTLAREPFDVEPLLRESWTLFETRAAERELSVAWDCTPAATLHTDRGLLQLIVRNILDNAVAYTPPGGHVAISTRTTGHAFEFSVRNSGCSLSEPQVQRVFERFWRADASRTPTDAHAGLGLALCRRLAAALGGQLTASLLDGDFLVACRLPCAAPQTVPMPS